jgi:hypothetical protein
MLSGPYMPAWGVPVAIDGAVDGKPLGALLGGFQVGVEEG